MRHLPLILILSAIVIFMLRPPGLYDSTRRKDASRRYFDAPSEMTKRVLDEVKHTERIEISICTFLSASLFVAGWLLLVRSRRQAQKHVA